MSGIVGFDHAIIVVDDLAAAAARFEADGFTISHRPDMPNGRTDTLFVAFEDGTYLMLMRFVSDTARDGHRLGRVASTGFAIADYGLHTDDIGGVAARLSAAGVAHKGPTRHEGRLTGGDAWAIDILLAGHGGGGSGALPFVVEDRGKRSLRVPATPGARAHRNGATGLVAIDVVADRPSVLDALSHLVDGSPKIAKTFPGPGTSSTFVVGAGALTVARPGRMAAGWSESMNGDREGVLGLKLTVLKGG